jgi:hypothetical protein
MIQSMEVSLGAHFPSRKVIAEGDFLAHLNVGSHRTGSSTDPGGAAWVDLFSHRFADFAGHLDAPDHFDVAVAKSMVDTAAWLGQHSEDLFEGFHERGLKVALYVNMWIDQDQIDLTLSPNLTLACGRRGVRIQFITNE